MGEDLPHRRVHPAAMVVDHQVATVVVAGQVDLADDARGLLQHCNQPTHFDTQVAAFFWGAGVDQTDKWAQLVGNRQRYVGQEMIGPTLLDLSGIRAVGAMYPVPESLAAGINEQVSREVLSNNGLIAFDREGRVTQ